MPIGTQTVTDDFNRANETPLAGNWTQGTEGAAQFNLTSNAVVQSATNVDISNFYNAWSGGDNQYSQVKVTAGEPAAGSGPGVCVRRSTTAATNTMYRFVVDNAGNYELAKILAGTFTSIATGTVTYAAGTAIGLNVNGTTLQMWYGGVQVGTDKTDSSISTGKPGLVYSGFSPSRSHSYDDWDAGTVGGGAPAANSNFLAFM